MTSTTPINDLYQQELRERGYQSDAAQLAAVAELERGIIRERSIAGQIAARERGFMPGRVRALSSEAETEVVRLYATGDYTMLALGKLFEVSESVVKRAIYRAKNPGHSSLK